MTDRLKIALKEVRGILQEEAHEHCTSVTVTFTSQGYDLSSTLRSPESLSRDMISMRNLRGEFIGGKLPCDPLIVSREKAIEWLTTIKKEAIPMGDDFGNSKIVQMCDQAIREMQS